MVYHRPILGKDEPYKLKSIQKERPPAGVEGIVVRLNERRLGAQDRIHLAVHPSKRSPA